MNSNRSLTISNHNQQNNENDHRRQGKYTAILTFCRVCNDKARYFHYGALVCASCKTFFRRYACYSKVCIGNNSLLYFLFLLKKI